MKWDNSYLLQLGMDGPSVNKAFEKKLSEKLHNEKSKSFINVVTCPLHIVRNSFRKAVTTFGFTFDEFFCNIHFFFKFSSGRREDLKDMKNIINSSVQSALCHVETRWLSMKRVAVRIINQWENLCQYFLKFLPMQKTFKQTVKKAVRYQSIKNALESDSTRIYLSFLVFAGSLFENVLLTCQYEEPLILWSFQRCVNYTVIFFKVYQKEVIIYRWTT